MTTCKDTEGRQTCTCMTPATTAMFFTEFSHDIDESTTDDHTCDVNASCKAEISSSMLEHRLHEFRLFWRPGLERVEIEELFQIISNFYISTTWTNTDGSYTRQCYSLLLHLWMRFYTDDFYQFDCNNDWTNTIIAHLSDQNLVN